MERISMTENALLDALRTACRERSEDAMTTSEIAELLGMSHAQSSAKIRKLCKAGAVECVRKMVVNVAGTVQPQPAYRMKGAQ